MFIKVFENRDPENVESAVNKWLVEKVASQTFKVISITQSSHSEHINRGALVGRFIISVFYSDSVL